MQGTKTYSHRLLPEQADWLREKGKPSAVLRFLIALAMTLEYMTEGGANERAD